MPDIIEKLKALKPDGLLWSHGIPGCYVISRAERDALLALVEPKTCATCKFWRAGKSQGEEMREAYIRNGWDAECGKQESFRKMFTVYVYGDGRVDDYEFNTPKDFGCAFHEPAPPSPRPSPSSETPETRA